MTDWTDHALTHDPAEIGSFDVDDVHRAFLQRIAAATPSWQFFAECAGAPLGLWFPTPGQSAAPARMICLTCPVRTDCLEEALADPALDHGIRAGLTPRQRQAMRAAAARSCSECERRLSSGQRVVCGPQCRRARNARLRTQGAA